MRLTLNGATLRGDSRTLTHASLLSPGARGHYGNLAQASDLTPVEHINRSAPSMLRSHAGRPRLPTPSGGSVSVPIPQRESNRRCRTHWVAANHGSFRNT